MAEYIPIYKDYTADTSFCRTETTMTHQKLYMEWTDNEPGQVKMSRVSVLCVSVLLGQLWVLHVVKAAVHLGNTPVFCHVIKLQGKQTESVWNSHFS